MATPVPRRQMVAGRALVLLSLLGSACAQCTQPTTVGYDFANVAETTLAQGLTFDVTAVACATGYTQAIGVLHVEASTCASDNTPYVVSGCSMCTIDYFWDGSACVTCAGGSTSEGPFGTTPMAASGAAASCVENTCAALTDAEWAALGCTVAAAAGDTVTAIGTLGEVAGFTGTCVVACDNVAFSVTGMTPCTALAECMGTTSCTTDATTGRTCSDCNPGFFPDDTNNVCAACTAIAECSGTTDCTTDATTVQTCDTCNTGYNPPDCAENTCTALTDAEWAALGCTVTTAAGTTVTTIGVLGEVLGFFGACAVSCDANAGAFTVTGMAPCTALANCAGTTSCTADAVTGRTCDACATTPTPGFFADDANNRCAPVHILDTTLPSAFTGTMVCTDLHDASTCSGVTCGDGFSTATLRLQTDALTTLPPAGTAVAVGECCEDTDGVCSNNRYGIGDFVCPVGYVPKTDANGNLIGDAIVSSPSLDAPRRTTSCCDRVFCTAADCPATKVLLPSALTALPAAGVVVSEAACCQDRAGMCSSNAVSAEDYTCPAGYAAKTGFEDIVSASTATATVRTAVCCDRVFCAATDCAATSVLKPDATSTLPSAGVAVSPTECCQARTGMCSSNLASADDFTCPTGYSSKSGFEDIASAAFAADADRISVCCDRIFCTSDLCLNPTKTLRASATMTLPLPGVAVSTLLCCEDRAGMCDGNAVAADDYTCPTGYTTKADLTTIASGSLDGPTARTAACCERVFCTAAVCTTTNTLRVDAETTLPTAGSAASDTICCEPRTGRCGSNQGTVGNYVCPAGYTNKDGFTDITSANTDAVATRTATCCDQVFCDTSVCTSGADEVTYHDADTQSLAAGDEIGITGCSLSAGFCSNDPSTFLSAYTLSTVPEGNEAGDTLAGTCTWGHTGSASAACGSNGQWSVSVECTAIPGLCTNSPDTVAGTYTLPAATTDNEAGDTVTGAATAGFTGTAEATCSATSATEGSWVVTTSPAVAASHCSAGVNINAVSAPASTFTLPSAATDNELSDTVVGVCADGYEGTAKAMCGASGTFEMLEQCTACSIGEAGTGSTCTACVQASCAPTDPLGSCAATDPNDAADVTTCTNVVNDGTAVTCTGATGTTSGCSYTAADAACAAVVLDGFALTCTSAGTCSYSGGTFTIAAGQTTCAPCNVCSVGQATLTDCRVDVDRSCQSAAGSSGTGACDSEACAATDANDATDVGLCNAIVLDGQGATCPAALGTSGCTYTPGTFSSWNGAATCTACTTCDAATEETDAACTLTSDRTCKLVTAHQPGAQAGAAITTSLTARASETSTRSSTKRATTRTTVATDRARVYSKTSMLEAEHATKLAAMRAKRSAMSVEIDAKVTARVATAGTLDSAHATMLADTNAAISAAQARVTTAMAAKDTEAARVSTLRTTQLEQHNVDTALLTSQRATFAAAAAAQKATLAATQGGIAGVAQEVLDAENIVSTSQATAGYTELLATPASAGRRLLAAEL